MICKSCKKVYDLWSRDRWNDYLCPKCDKKWEKFYSDHGADYIKISDLREQGHTHHCACRMVWGDGICTCRKGSD